MKTVENVQPVSRGEPCVDCGRTATVTVDQYGMPSQDKRCRDCYESHCSRVYREASSARK
jgi:hypothetical protein